MSLLTRASLQNRLLIGLLTLAIAVVGFFSIGSLKQELQPPTTVPSASVSAQVTGLAPTEMVTAVTEPVEAALDGIAGVTTVTSNTQNGSATITAKWGLGQDDDETLAAIRSAVDALKPTLPSTAEVQVSSGGSADLPAMVLTASSSTDSVAFGGALAQTVVPALQAVPGVRTVELSGREEQRIVVDLRPADVAAHKVDVATLGPLLKAQGAAAPAGQAESSQGPLSITVGTALGSIDDIAALPVPVRDGVVRLSDFADVHADTVPTQTLSRVNGELALTLLITASPGANVVDISHAVNAELDRLGPTIDAHFATIFDQAPYIEQSIHDLSVEGGLGLLFAVLVILSFLWSWRSTAIAAMSIPLSLLITLIGLSWSGNTLNILTLAALTIAVGRVVDDSIVVIENITRRRGDGPITIEGVVASVRQVAGAITASTITTVAVFVPIAFVSGSSGALFRPFAITMSIALLASLLVALTIVPVLAFWFLKRSTETSSAPVSGAAHSELDEIHTAPDRLQRTFMPALNATRRRPVITLVAAGLLLVVTIAMAGFIKTDFLGSSGNEALSLDQTTDAATAEDLIAVAEPVEKALGGIEGIKEVTTSISLPQPGSPTTIGYSAQLDKGVKAVDIGPSVQRALDDLPDGADISLQAKDNVGGGGAVAVGAAAADIPVKIRSKDLGALQEANDLLEAQLGDVEAVGSITSELSEEQPVLQVNVDEVIAAQLGFDRATIATAVSEALAGSPVGAVTLEGQERNIVIRTPGSERTADKLGEVALPVTAKQTAAAQKAASDALEAKAKAKAAEARTKSEDDLRKQRTDAEKQRAALVPQLRDLSGQLAALESAPIEPGEPQTPEGQAAVQAQQERAEQIAGLQSAIEGARSGIAGADEQLTGLRKSEEEAAKQFAEAEAEAAEQKAATEVVGTPIPLSAIATVEQVGTPPLITRAEGEYEATLTVTPAEGKTTAATAAVNKTIADTDLPTGVSFDQGRDTAEQDQAFRELGLAMLVAILLVLLIMIATFRNFRGPLVLLISIPFAATGAILSLLITGTPLGLPALIGLLMLIGIVVTNAIVLMDLVARLRGAGASLEEAVEHGTRLRLRPILMTAAATVFALIPMGLGLTGGGVFISRPLAIVVIGGLLSSTVLTLVLVPVLYTLVERGRDRRIARREQRRADRAARAEGAEPETVDAHGIESLL